jgi:hypothetical protein
VQGSNNISNKTSKSFHPQYYSSFDPSRIKLKISIFFHAYSSTFHFGIVSSIINKITNVHVQDQFLKKKRFKVHGIVACRTSLEKPITM